MLPINRMDPLGLDDGCTWNPATLTLNCPPPPPVETEGIIDPGKAVEGIIRVVPPNGFVPPPPGQCYSVYQDGVYTGEMCGDIRFAGNGAHPVVHHAAPASQQTQQQPAQQPQQQPCIQPNLAQRLIISGLNRLARLTGITLGVGIGGSASASPSPYPGGGGGASVQIVVSPNGQAALETSHSAGGAIGSGAVGGAVVSVSNARNPQDLAGPFGQVSGGYGNGGGVGLDVAFSRNVWQASLTGGAGVGRFGALSATQETTVQFFCPQPK